MGQACAHDRHLQPARGVRHRLEHDDGVLGAGQRAARDRVHLSAALHGARHDGWGHYVMTDTTSITTPPFDVVGLGVNALDLIAVVDGFAGPDAKLPRSQSDVQAGGRTATAMGACGRPGLRSRYDAKSGKEPGPR